MCALAYPADRRECACGTKDAEQRDKNSNQALVRRDGGPGVPGWEDGAAEPLRRYGVVMAIVGMEERCGAGNEDHAGKGKEGGEQVSRGEGLMEGGNKATSEGCHDRGEEGDHSCVGKVEIR